LKYDLKGNFVKEFFAKGISKGNADTNALNRPSDAFIYSKTNEVFISDGYGNRRVIVLDADSGAFKRMWAAFGKPPDNNPPAGAVGGGGREGRGAGQGAQAPARGAFPQEGAGPDTFGNPVHAIKISNDGLVYVADRANRRVQIFTPEGKYVTQVFINRALPSQGTAAGIAFSPDKAQTFMYVSDLGNSHMLVIDRKTLELLYEFGPLGSKPGEFRAPHQISVDSKGNLYTAEVNPGNRAQKFVYKGTSKTVPANALTAAQLTVGVTTTAVP
jgi:DNA-binding beta-propeller fold protein YncE